MVTHDPYAASYTDRILYFKDGHIISELQRHDAERRHFYEAIMQESARQDEKR
jgi:putative ABC transport system ATP-binding protein